MSDDGQLASSFQDVSDVGHIILQWDHMGNVTLGREIQKAITAEVEMRSGVMSCEVQTSVPPTPMWRTDGFFAGWFCVGICCAVVGGIVGFWISRR